MKKALLLLSSGIDSPVAGWLLKSKFEIDGVHFDNVPLGDAKAAELAKKLAKKIGLKKLFVVDHGKNQIKFKEGCNRRYQCVLCKRMMFRVAEKLAEKHGYDALITGESLGQVASQSLTNMVVNQQTVRIPILRPLLAYNKSEAIKIAKEIGTFDISIEPVVCCNAVPKHPATKAKKEIVENEEQRVAIAEMIKESVKTAQTLKI